MTILDRLLGRAAPEKAGTGGTGAGVLAYNNDIPLWQSSRNPRRLMRQAQELYHTHAWVHAAEQRVSMAAAGLPWHLEDENDEEITADSAPELKAIRDLFERPQQYLPPTMKRMTRRSLWQVTYRHEGLCGNGFWYKDQRNGLTGIPLAFLYINPARMTATYDKAGNTVGWKLDADDEGNGGLPLELSEVIQFEYDPPDSGAYGIGIVEAAGMKAQLSSLADQQMGSVLASGGRLSGIITPKEANTGSSDDWDGFVRGWRNIVGDPDAAKRVQILKAPIEYHRTVATPAELQIEAISKLSRDDVTSLWGVPLSQLGVEQPAGLNSGSTKSYDEAILYQGAVHARVMPFRETIQYEILDEIARQGGPSVQLVIDEPEYDDETPAYDRASKAIDQPLRNRERRAILGLEPFGDPLLDEAVWMPSSIIEMALAPDDTGAMPKPTPEQAAMMAEEQAAKDAAAASFAPVAKARLDPLKGLRRTLDRRVPAVQKSVRAVLREQGREIAARVRAKGAHLKSKPSDVSTWWNEKAAAAALRKALEPHATAIASQVTTQTRTLMARPAKADTFAENVAQAVRSSVGERITLINKTTRDAVSALIAQGFDDGLSPAEIGDLIESATTFDESRAELIARTETAMVYNESALRSYGEFGVSEVEAIDGDNDEECANRDGQVYPLEEAMAITDHPNGTLDWSPVIKAEIVPDPMALAIKALADGQLAMADSHLAIANLSQRPINITNPDVRVAPAVINFSPPDVHVPVTVNLPEPRPIRKTIERDADGRITGVTDGE